jgi:hypothetical protein
MYELCISMFWMRVSRGAAKGFARTCRAKNAKGEFKSYNSSRHCGTKTLKHKAYYYSSQSICCQLDFYRLITTIKIVVSVTCNEGCLLSIVQFELKNK